MAVILGAGGRLV